MANTRSTLSKKNTKSPRPEEEMLTGCRLCVLVSFSGGNFVLATGSGTVQADHKCYVVEDDFELCILLPLPPKHGIYRHCYACFM